MKLECKEHGTIAIFVPKDRVGEFKEHHRVEGRCGATVKVIKDGRAAERAYPFMLRRSR